MEIDPVVPEITQNEADAQSTVKTSTDRPASSTPRKKIGLLDLPNKLLLHICNDVVREETENVRIWEWMIHIDAKQGDVRGKKRRPENQPDLRIMTGRPCPAYAMNPYSIRWDLGQVDDGWKTLWKEISGLANANKFLKNMVWDVVAKELTHVWGQDVNLNSSRWPMYTVPSWEQVTRRFVYIANRLDPVEVYKNYKAKLAAGDDPRDQLEYRYFTW